MSTPAEHTWGDVFENFLDAIKDALYEIGSKIKEHAVTIAEVVVAGVVAYVLYRNIRRLPFVGALTARLGL